jgi:hypothetical protein
MTRDELINDYSKKIKYWLKLIKSEEAIILPKDPNLLIIPEEAKSDFINK